MRDVLSGALSHLLSHAQASGEARAGTCWTNLSPLGPGIAEAAMHCHFVFRSVCPKGGAQQGPGAKLVDDLPTAQWFCGDPGMGVPRGLSPPQVGTACLASRASAATVRAQVTPEPAGPARLARAVAE